MAYVQGYFQVVKKFNWKVKGSKYQLHVSFPFLSYLFFLIKVNQHCECIYEIVNF